MIPESSQLGKKAEYISTYTPELLYPIPRKLKRDEIGISEDSLPFSGVDIWNHYEVSWLNAKGKPQVAIAIIVIPATSQNIIESKSMKLYFNSFNNYKLASKEELAAIIEKDLAHNTMSDVKVELLELDTAQLNIAKPQGISIDDLDIEVNEYCVNPELLKANPGKMVSESLYSNLLKSNCLVTHQPDWATVMIDYTGPAIDHACLLKYIISFRNHNEFHEQCVERIFNDILKNCNPAKLTVSARFTRRGGVDINPIRSTEENLTFTNTRLVRQ